MKKNTKSIWIKSKNHSNPTQIKCSIADHFLTHTPVPLVFFYQQSISPQTITEAIQFALHDYSLFAGRMRKKNHHLYIDCNNAGVKFTIEHNQCSMMQTINHLYSKPKIPLVDMINPSKILKNDEPVLTIKLTSFRCGGTSLGFCWNHCIGDMMSFMSFLKHASNFVSDKESVLAKITDNRETYLDRHFKKNSITHSKKTAHGLTYLKSPDLIKLIFYILKHRKSQQGVTLYFSEDEIQAMKLDYAKKTDKKLTRNDVLCAHITNILSNLSPQTRLNTLSIIINYRSRINLSQNLIGNFISTLTVPCNEVVDSKTLACNIRNGILNYHLNSFNYEPVREFIHQQGGVRSIRRIIPTILLPKQKNLMVTNWCQFDVYNITFDCEKPFFVIPYGKAPLPWLSSVMPGLHGKGLLFSMVLPKAISKKIASDRILSKIHTYRSSDENLPAEFLHCDWML